MALSYFSLGTTTTHPGCPVYVEGYRGVTRLTCRADDDSRVAGFLQAVPELDAETAAHA